MTTQKKKTEIQQEQEYTRKMKLKYAMMYLTSCTLLEDAGLPTDLGNKESFKKDMKDDK